MQRRTLRSRKVSQRMAVVDESERKQAVAARLEALENDIVAQDTGAGDSDDEEFILRDDGSDEDQAEAGLGSKKQKRKKAKIDGGMRKTRGMISGSRAGPRTFRDWLDESGLEDLPESKPNYLTAATGPPRTRTPRKLCSVCGDLAPYTCTRCGARFCSIRCSGIHSDTRCLKFMT